jgi:uncharacterized protein (TIRG00374 family)
MPRFADPRLILRIAASLALIAFLLWRIDLGQAAEALREADYIYVIPGLALFGVAKLLVTQRWRLMMSEFAAPPLSPMFGVLLVSNLANNILPMRLGDLIRVQVPAQRYGTSRARLAATVFATESLLDGLAFAVIGLIGLALIDLQGFPTEVFWGLLGLVVGGLLAVIPLSHLRLNDGWECRGLWAKLPDRAQSMLETSMPHFIDGLAVFRTMRLALPAIALSFAIWFLEVAMFVLFGRAFGITLSLPAWMLIMVSANVISALPITPSNVGAYELAITELTIALGVDPGTAAAFAIATHMFNILWITVAGAIAMVALRLTVADVFSLRTAEERTVEIEAREREAPAAS